jgi:molybdopterin molybdotransferase
VPRQAIELDEARALVLSRVVPLATERVELAQALGRMLAEPLRAAADLPGFDNSAMDGFALRAGESAPGARLRVVGESRAGAPSRPALGAGEACAISTGAAIPPGADAVVRVEDTRRDGDDVELAVAVPVGASVRYAGEDVKAGEALLEPGVRLGPAELGILAALGSGELTAYRRPRVGVVTTGDELIAVGGRLPPGGVHDSGCDRGPSARRAGRGEVDSVAHARDSAVAIEQALERALVADVVVVCGGMSVGEHDHVGAVLDALGVAREFAGVALRPGRPTLFGTRGETLVFGLPGNPVSSFVTFLIFVRPALLALAGERPDARRARAKLAKPAAREPGRIHAVRCTLELRDDGWWATSTGAQGSHVLRSLLGADAFALIPAGEGQLDVGAQVVVELI